MRPQTQSLFAFWASGIIGERASVFGDKNTQRSHTPFPLAGAHCRTCKRRPDASATRLFGGWNSAVRRHARSPLRTCQHVRHKVRCCFCFHPRTGLTRGHALLWKWHRTRSGHFLGIVWLLVDMCPRVHPILNSVVRSLGTKRACAIDRGGHAETKAGTPAGPRTGHRPTPP